MAKAAPQKSIFSPEYDRFLALLRKARADAGLTQAEAATKLNRLQSFISKCESGERRVDVVELVQFCSVYDVNPAKFIQRLLG